MGSVHRPTAVILAFPRRRHDDAPAGSAVRCNRASASNVTSATPRPSAISESVSHRPGGMRPRASQLLTHEASTPRSSATLVVPPSAVMTDLTDMDAIYFTKREDVKPHDMAGDFRVLGCPNLAMSLTNKEIAYRIKKAREALGISAADLCRELDIGQNRWSQYESGERRITLVIAVRLAEDHGIGLDWTYRGDASDLPSDIRPKVMQAIRADHRKIA